MAITSQIQLANELPCSCRCYVALKIFVNSTSMGKHLDDEFTIYNSIRRGSKIHPGHNAITSLLDSFDVDEPEDKHRCLAHPALWESVWAFLHRNPVRRLPKPVLAFALQRLFLALDYLHTECQVIHTGMLSGPVLFVLSTCSADISIRPQSRQYHVWHCR